MGVVTRERALLAASQKMSVSRNEVMSDVVSPIESKLQVRIGPGPVAYAVLFAVLRVSRPVPLDLGFPDEMLRGINLSVSKSLKRPPAIV